MAWDTTQPTTATKLRLVPSVINPNWVAIQNGEVPCVKWRLSEQAADPALVANAVQLYSKEDATSGYTELFCINSNGDAIQLTQGAVEQLTPLAPTLGATGQAYLPGGLLVQWGTQTGPGSGTTWTVTFATAFSAIYAVVGNSSSQARLGTVTSKSTTGFVATSTSTITTQTFTWIAIGAA